MRKPSANIPGNDETPVLAEPGPSVVLLPSVTTSERHVTRSRHAKRAQSTPASPGEAPTTSAPDLPSRGGRSRICRDEVDVRAGLHISDLEMRNRAPASTPERAKRAATATSRGDPAKAVATRGSHRGPIEGSHRSPGLGGWVRTRVQQEYTRMITNPRTAFLVGAIVGFAFAALLMLLP